MMVLKTSLPSPFHTNMFGWISDVLISEIERKRKFFPEQISSLLNLNYIL